MKTLKSSKIICNQPTTVRNSSVRNHSPLFSEPIGQHYRQILVLSIKLRFGNGIFKLSHELTVPSNKVKERIKSKEGKETINEPTRDSFHSHP